MQDWDSMGIKKMYLTARQCLNEKKNKRPDITEVCTTDASIQDNGSIAVLNIKY